MLWFNLLQNTIYCGKLHLTSYQHYGNVGWGSLVSYREKSGGKRDTIEDLVLCSFRRPIVAIMFISKYLTQVKVKEES
jgi:hypothetical protein